ncbi:hypothetical protein J3R83DRAFT_11688 [Lanmaoa asiatica]|nr:hypothetical protein J3R83DRAFT_11688 [Lanmaoa asiatica]
MCPVDMASLQSSSKHASACVESSILSLSSHIVVLSNATVVLCSREDLASLCTPRRSQSCPAHCATPTSSRVSTPSSPVQVPHSPSTVAEAEHDPMSDAASTDSSMESLRNKIPKPEGEPGRPGRGGYNLKVQLAWDNSMFLKLKKSVHHSIAKHLDATKCRSLQTIAAIQLVKKEALREFPHLDDYASCWPVEDLIRMRLKYTSERARLSRRVRPGKSKEKED